MFLVNLSLSTGEPLIVNDSVFRRYNSVTKIGWSSRMSLSTDALLFGIALVGYGIWMEVDGYDGTLYVTIGIALAAIGFLGSVIVAMRATPTSGDATAKGEQS